MTNKYAFFFVLCCLSTKVLSDSNTPGKVVAGWVEKVIIENQNYPVKAKLDSGAKTSSIYATNVEQFKKNEQNWVRFTLNLRDTRKKLHTFTIEKKRERRVKIKNHDGVHDSRVTVELDICFNGRKETAEFTLADRNEYIYGVLLGRDFLKNRTLIDSAETFLTKAACD